MPIPDDPDKVNRLVKVLSISVGEKDNLAFQGPKPWPTC